MKKEWIIIVINVYVYDKLELQKKIFYDFVKYEILYQDIPLEYNKTNGTMNNLIV